MLGGRGAHREHDRRVVGARGGRTATPRSTETVVGSGEEAVGADDSELP
jgi:hypothetical protein